MHKSLFFAGSAAVGAVLIYFGGVYFTGKVVNEKLQNISEYLSAEPKFKAVSDDYELSYTQGESSMFGGKGTLEVQAKDDKEKFAVKLDVAHRFLSSIICFDMEDFYSQIKGTNDEELLKGFIKDSIKSQAYIKIHLLPESLTIHYDLRGNYEENKHKPLKIDLDVSYENDYEFKGNLALQDVYTTTDEGNPLELKSMLLSTSFQGFPTPQYYGQGNLKIDGLNSSELQLDDFVFSYKSGEVKKDGSFPLQMSLEIDKLNQYVEDLAVKLNLKSLNLKVLNELIGKDKLSDQEQKKILSGIREVEIDEFDFKLLPDALKLLKTLGLAVKQDKMEVKFGGKLKHDGSVTAEGLSGSFKVKCDEDVTGGQFLEADGDHYKADIEVNAGKISVNGKLIE